MYKEYIKTKVTKDYKALNPIKGEIITTIYLVLFFLDSHHVFLC